MSGVTTILAARPTTSMVRHGVDLTFDQLVQTFIDSGDVTSYWKFQNNGTDQMGVSNATITGFPEFGVPTLVRGDTIIEGADVEGQVIAWPGTSGEFAEAAHASALKTAAGTIIIYFQRDTAGQKSQLLMSDATGAAGGFAIGVNPNGTPDAYIRGPGGVPVTLPGGIGDVVLDRAYCIMLKWGPQLELVLYDGNGLVRRVISSSTVGLSGTSAIRFGATHAATDRHDGPYGRIIWMDRSISAVEEQLFGDRAKSIARSAAAYRQLTLGMSPMALWGMGEFGGTTIVDSAGNRNGTYSGLPTFLQPDLPSEAIDGSVNFGGVATGLVPHDVGMVLPLFSLSLWMHPNIVPTEGQPFQPVISKQHPTVAGTPGDMSLAVLTEGALRLRFHDGVTPQDLVTAEGVIVAGQTYHIGIRAGTTGFSLFVNGIRATSTTYTAAWSNNTQVLRFADSPFFSADGNMRLDEITLFPRILSDTEMLQLAQRSGTAPVAVDDTASVPESATTLIDVLANDTFVGEPTIEILTQPASGTPSTDFVTVSGTQINYIAGAVAADTARSFTYRIVDTNGTSNTATVSVTVLNTDTVPDPIANCFTLGAPDFTVTAMTGTNGLQQRVNTDAAPGDVIQIAAGTYNGGTISFSGAGNAANPIVIRAPSRAAADRVTINNAVWTLTGASRRLVFVNIFFNNARIAISGSNNRFTRCQFRQVENRTFTLNAATDTRLDHLDISGYTNNTVTKEFITINNTNVNNGSFRRLLVDYVYYHDITMNVAGAQTSSAFIRTTSSGQAINIDAGITVDHCLFKNNTFIEQGEFIVLKHSGFKVRYCTFEDIDGYLEQRQGGGWEVRSNWFENVRGSGPIIAFDTWNCGNASGSRRALVIGNRIHSRGLQAGRGIWIGTGDENCDTADGGAGAGGAEIAPGGHYRSRSGQYIGNIVDAPGVINTGRGFTTNAPDHTFLALNNNVFGNTATIQAGDQNGQTAINPATGTIADPPTNTSVTPWYTFTPAVKLVPADVGLGAPDPLCPSGPQT